MGKRSSLKSFYDYEIAFIEHEFLGNAAGLSAEDYKAYCTGVRAFAQRIIDEIQGEEN